MFTPSYGQGATRWPPIEYFVQDAREVYSFSELNLHPGRDNNRP